MVFQKAISRLQNLTSRKAKNTSKKSDISAEAQTVRGEHESDITTHLNKDKVKNVLFKNLRRK